MKIIVFSCHTKSLFWFRIDFMRELKMLHHEVVAIGQEEEVIWKSIFQKEGIEYKCIKFKRNSLNPINDLLAFMEIIFLLKKEKPDRLFLYQAKPIIYGCIAARIIGIKGIYSLVAGLGSIFRQEESNKWLKIIMLGLYRIAFTVSDKIIFQNNDDLEKMVEMKIVSRRKTEMINGSGVNMEVFTRKKFPKYPSFLCVGRLLRDKGIPEYMEAARLIKQKYPRVEFVLVGPFDSNPSALSRGDLAPFINDGSISYAGESKDVRSFYEKCTVFVLPSHHEGTPKTVLEAMATGRPVITTNAPGCRDTVIDGETGFLVRVGDVQELAEKMLYLLQNMDICLRMGEVGYEYCKRKYDVHDVNKEILRILHLS